MKNGLDKIQEFFSTMAKNAGDGGPSLIVAAAIIAFRFGLNRDIVGAFLSKRSPDGVPWPPRKNKYSHPLLILSGDMLEGAINSCEGGTETEEGVTIPLEGPPYRLVHQFGITNKIPQRKFFGLTDQTHKDVAKVVEKTTASTTNLFNAAANAAR